MRPQPWPQAAERLLTEIGSTQLFPLLVLTGLVLTGVHPQYIYAPGRFPVSDELKDTTLTGLSACTHGISGVGARTG